MIVSHFLLAFPVTLLTSDVLNNQSGNSMDHNSASESNISSDIEETRPFRANLMPITAFTRTRQLTLSFQRWLQLTPFHYTSLRSILILFSHLRLPSDRSNFPTKTLYIFLMSAPYVPHIHSPAVWATEVFRFLSSPRVSQVPWNNNSVWIWTVLDLKVMTNDTHFLFKGEFASLCQVADVKEQWHISSKCGNTTK